MPGTNLCRCIGGHGARNENNFGAEAEAEALQSVTYGARTGAAERPLARRRGAPAREKIGVSLLIQEHFLHFLKKSEQAGQGPGPDLDLKGPNHLMVMVVVWKRGRP